MNQVYGPKWKDILESIKEASGSPLSDKKYRNPYLHKFITMNRYQLAKKYPASKYKTKEEKIALFNSKAFKDQLLRGYVQYFERLKDEWAGILKKDLPSRGVNQDTSDEKIAEFKDAITQWADDTATQIKYINKLGVEGYVAKVIDERGALRKLKREPKLSKFKESVNESSSDEKLYQDLLQQRAYAVRKRQTTLVNSLHKQIEKLVRKMRKSESIKESVNESKFKVSDLVKLKKPNRIFPKKGQTFRVSHQKGNVITVLDPKGGSDRQFHISDIELAESVNEGIPSDMIKFIAGNLAHKGKVKIFMQGKTSTHDTLMNLLNTLPLAKMFKGGDKEKIVKYAMEKGDHTIEFDKSLEERLIKKLVNDELDNILSKRRHINEKIDLKKIIKNMAKAFKKIGKAVWKDLAYYPEQMQFARKPRLTKFLGKGDFTSTIIKDVNDLKPGDYLSNLYWSTMDRNNPNMSEWVKEVLPNGSVKMESGITFTEDQVLHRMRLIPGSGREDRWDENIMNKKEKLLRELIRKHIKEILKESFSDGTLESEESIRKTAEVLGMKLVGELDKPSFDLRKKTNNKK
jgi:IS1 family transposase